MVSYHRSRGSTGTLKLSKHTLKTASSWILVVLCFLIGLFALTRVGGWWPPDGDHYSGWFLRWFTFVGTALIAVAFLAAASIAPWCRKLAAKILIVFMPLAAYFIALPDSGYLVWYEDGGYFETPLPSIAAGLTIVFYLPLLAAWISKRNRRVSAYVFLITVIGVALIGWLTYWPMVLFPRLAVWSALFCVFALFWWGTEKLGWTQLIRSSPSTLLRRVTFTLGITAVIAVSYTFAVIGMSVVFSSSNGPDCGGRRLFDHQLSSEHAVFTARVLRVGHGEKVAGRWVGNWALARVNDEYWGLPWWMPRFVLLNHGIFWEREIYFVDGERDRGYINRFLPLMTVRCSRTRPVRDALVELRVLREQEHGGRIVGVVRKPESSRSILEPPSEPKLLAGAVIRLAGPYGRKTAITDESGIYEFNDLAPGDYSIDLDVPKRQVAVFRGRENPAKIHLDPNQLANHDFDLFWNGRIEGRVVDDSGKPARAWIILGIPDDTAARHFQVFQPSEANGSYALSRIPPGRYVVFLNVHGPSEESPYNQQYYPAGSKIADARVFQLSEGEQLKQVDLVLPRLVERLVTVRVLWPNGTPVLAAWVCVAYEGTQDYNDLQGTVCHYQTKSYGEVPVKIYGKTRVRIFALQYGDSDEKKYWWYRYYSPPFESAADQTPDKVELVLTQKRGEYPPGRR